MYSVRGRDTDRETRTARLIIARTLDCASDVSRVSYYLRKGSPAIRRRTSAAASETLKGHIAVTYEEINAKYRYNPKDWRERYLPNDQRTPYSAAASRPERKRTLLLL